MSRTREASRKQSVIDWRLLRFLSANLAIGAIAGCGFVAAALALDLGGLGTLVASSSDRVLAVVILCAGMTITWGSASMGTAMFLLPKAENNDNSGRKVRATGPISARPAFVRAGRQP